MKFDCASAGRLSTAIWCQKAITKSRIRNCVDRDVEAKRVDKKKKDKTASPVDKKTEEKTAATA